METGSYDADRLFTTRYGPGCGWNCPKCSCPADFSNIGDTWYHEYQDVSDLDNNRASCMLCECAEDNDGNLYADCEYFSSYTIGTGVCSKAGIEELSFSCHSQSGSSTGTTIPNNTHDCNEQTNLI